MGHIDPWSSNNVFLIPKARRPPKIFNVQLFNFFWKRMSKWPCVDLQSMKRNKVMKFGKPSPDIQAMADKSVRSGSY